MRRTMAIVGGLLLGIALSAESILFDRSGGSGYRIAGVVAGLGVGLLVAATIRED